jgi:hypothetical protein
MKQQNLSSILMMAIAIALIAASATTAVNAAPAKTIFTGKSASNSTSPSNTSLEKRPKLTRIRFAPGATSAQVSGYLPQKTRTRYVLRALAGQFMEITLSAPQGIIMEVGALSDRGLTPLSSSSTSFRGYLPRNGSYYIDVKTGPQAGSYSVFVSIPERISFARGAASATRAGNVGAQQSHEYVLKARVGQIMKIDLSAVNSLQLIIYGVDGTVLKSGMGEGSKFRGKLPLSQDYILVVRAGAVASAYSLAVTIR